MTIQHVIKVKVHSINLKKINEELGDKFIDMKHVTYNSGSAWLQVTCTEGNSADVQSCLRHYEIL